ncbi:U3 small nucleolar RNA-associated protein [Trichinella pseudospiralis]
MLRQHGALYNSQHFLNFPVFGTTAKVATLFEFLLLSYGKLQSVSFQSFSARFLPHSNRNSRSIWHSKRIMLSFQKNIPEAKVYAN